MAYLRTLTVCLVAALGLGLAVVSSAASAPPTPAPPAASGGLLPAVSGSSVLPTVSGNTGLQPFFPSPNSTGAAQMYRANLMPISDPNTPEILNFACTFPPSLGASYRSYIGTPISKADRTALQTAIDAARQAYTDGGLAKMNESTAASVTSLRALGGRNTVVAELLNPTANDPSQLGSGVPFGCGLGEFNNFPSAVGNAEHIGSLFSNPALYVWGIFVGLAGDINRQAFYTAEPLAFSRLFWTPHSERGDTIFNVNVDSCQSGYSSTCSATKQTLGFNTTNTQLNQPPPLWIRISMFFQWLISLTYFIIFAGAAVLFMFRGHHPKTAQSVQTLLPRLIISILLVIFSSWIIGTMITLSNLLVTTLFSDPATMHGVRDVFLAFGASDFAGSFTGPFKQMFQVVALGIADFFFFAFYIAALVRQLALVILIVLAPVGISAMIFDRTRAYFSKYWTILGTLIATPIALALVLKVGIALNPGVNAADSGSMGLGTGIVGVLMLFITFWVMLRILKVARSVITGKQTPGMMGRLGKASAMGGRLVSAWNPALGTAMQGAGKILERGEQRTGQAVGALIPSERMKALTTRRMPKDGAQQSLAREFGNEMIVKRGLIKGALPGGSKPDAAQSALRAVVLSTVMGNNSKVQSQFRKYASMAEATSGYQEVTEPLFMRVVRRYDLSLMKAKQDANTLIEEGKAAGWDMGTLQAKLKDNAQYVRFDKNGEAHFDDEVFRTEYTGRYGDFTEKNGRYYRTYNTRGSGSTRGFGEGEEEEDIGAGPGFGGPDAPRGPGSGPRRSGGTRGGGPSTGTRGPSTGTRGPGPGVPPTGPDAAPPRRPDGRAAANEYDAQVPVSPSPAGPARAAEPPEGWAPSPGGGYLFDDDESTREEL